MDNLSCGPATFLDFLKILKAIGLVRFAYVSDLPGFAELVYRWCMGEEARRRVLMTFFYTPYHCCKLWLYRLRRSCALNRAATRRDHLTDFLEFPDKQHALVQQDSASDSSLVTWY